MKTLLIENGIHMNFDESCNEKCVLHFMTHIDAEIGKPTIPNNVKYIYTSEYNAWVLQNKYKIEPSRIVSLPIDTLLHFVDKETKLDFNITLFNANHNPGSVMCLFESTSLGTILYTGNFCYKPSLLSSTVFKRTLLNKKFTCLYLDVTYLRFRKELPTKRIVVHRMVNLIKSQPDHKVCIFIKDLLLDGVLNDIAIKIQEPIYVNDLKMNFLRSLKKEDGFTSDPTKARVYALCLDTDDVLEFVKVILKNNSPVLKILVSTTLNLTTNVKEIQKNGIHLFTYRTHSSPEDLKLIISRLKPKQVHPISQADDTILQDFLQRINYQNTKNNSINKRNDFWKNIGKWDKLCNPNLLNERKPVDVNPNYAVTTQQNNRIETISISGESSVGSVTSQSIMLGNNQLSTNDFSVNLDKEKCSEVNNLPMNSDDCISVESSSLAYSLKEVEATNLECDIVNLEEDSNCDDKILQRERGVRRGTINKPLCVKETKHSRDLKKTLLNLNYKVEVCNIVESVNFLQTLGLRPTWKNQVLYKSPEKSNRLMRENRRKAHQNSNRPS